LRPRLHEHQGDLSRRAFLTKVTVGFSGVIGLLAGVPVLGYLLGPITRPVPQKWISLGPTNSFPIGETKLVKFTDDTSLPWSGLTELTALWARQQSAGVFDVWAVNCTHLGCPVNWLPQAQLFECPCHGGIFYSNGTVAAGPPPRPLYKHPVRVQNGMLQALTFPLPTD